ncbi:MarR family transcriptional regulator [Aneurinibacillus sp. Ricciae_BoGa-3]|uniref:MarR family winged helix-turn-helix transcriptional regulator n=1 Tax=Aneurinibacillus sp. Ricciae_BoGa-3 TaxID=3022697 RepID=UPI00233FBE3F|nr:MarR family transcriptional regulator [Aneurinibacillus sp. Ricciae_BoGa-3]WCK54279.1 MarR family transcriptional regulator [Aneurinibacillus sp. Ricciae_BoGa-3]
MEGASKQIRMLIRQINHNIFELLACELSAVGITVPQLLVLRTLKEERRKISEIAQQVNLSSSTISGIVDRLEAEGYVQRVRDTEDRRIVWVYQTDKAKELKNLVPVLGDSYFDSFLEGISDEETKAILHSLDLLSTHLKEKLCERKSQK